MKIFLIKYKQINEDIGNDTISKKAGAYFVEDGESGDGD